MLTCLRSTRPIAIVHMAGRRCRWLALYLKARNLRVLAPFERRHLEEGLGSACPPPPPPGVGKGGGSTGLAESSSRRTSRHGPTGHGTSAEARAPGGRPRPRGPPPASGRCGATQNSCAQGQDSHITKPASAGNRGLCSKVASCCNCRMPHAQKTPFQPFSPAHSQKVLVVQS